MPAITLDRALRLATWPLALWIAYIFVVYLEFKFLGYEGSVWTFQTIADWLGIGAWQKPFRLGVGAAELVAAVLVVLPWTRIYGAGMALGIMTGAIFFHVASPLGIDPFEDGATLFKEAISVWASAAFILFGYRDQVRALLARLGVLRPAPMAEHRA
jgi:uncharacterized membrane protein YphA (DoxX/SURF4 family)